MPVPLQGDPYNLQGSNPNIQGGNVAAVIQPSASPVYGPVQPTAVPQPAPKATPAPSPNYDLTGKYGLVGSTVYRKSDNYAFSNPQDFFRETGLTSWNGVKLDTSYNPSAYKAPAPVSVTNYSPAPPPVSAPASNAVITDPNQKIAQNAGMAGLSFEDYQKIIAGQNGLSQTEKDTINKSLGIPALEESVFALPSKSTTQLYNDAYASAGLADLKTKVQSVIDQINSIRGQFTDASANVNENPFLSEASRVGRISRLQDKYQAQIGNLTNELSQLQDLYNNGVSEVNSLVSRQSQDFTTNQQLNASKLTYLLKKAEDQYATATSAKTNKAYTYLPDYLNAKAKAQKPDTIGSAETGYYRWNPDTGTFEQVIDPLDKSNEILSPTDALALGVPYGTTRGQAMQLGIIPQKPATDAQNQAAGYALRIQQSGDILNNLESAIQGYNPVGFEAQMKLPSYAQSGTIQSYNQAARNFINAVLRRESGAAISQSEFDNAYQQYLPRPGDSEEVLAQKKANREAVYSSLVNSAGPAYQSLTGSGNANDPLGLYKEMGGGVAAAISTKYPEGSTGGQCGDFAHQLVQFPPVGDSKTEKIAAVQKYGIPTSQWKPQVGDVIITGENPTYGHVAVVNAVLPDGKIQLSESNFKQSGKVSNDRVISASSPQIYGAIRGTLKI